MAYTAWSVVFGETPSAAKWGILGTNDAHFYSFLGDNLAWQDWTPSYANITVGNGTVVAKYIQIGKTTHAIWTLTCGSTTAISNTNTISLPVTAANVANTPAGTAFVFDDSTASRYAGWAILNTTTTVRPEWGSYGGTTGQVSNAFPITEAAADVYSFEITYQAA